MPLKKFCAVSGCNCVIPITERYCQKHKRTKQEQNSEYDQKQRDQKAKRFYNSKEWKYTREAVLARDTGIDVYLFITQGRIVPATLVHHIVELKEDYNRRCDMNNLISVSDETHEGVIRTAYDKGGEYKRRMQKELIRAMKQFQELKG